MQNIKAILKLGYLFLVPIVLAFVFESIFKTISWNIFFDVIENSLFAILLISPLYVFYNSKWNAVYIILAFLFFCICTYFETAYYYLFNTYFSPSAVFVVLDSSLNEASEFIGFYMDVPLMVFTLVFWMVSLVLLFKVKSLLPLSLQRSRKNTIKIGVTVLAIVVFLKISTLIVFNLPYLLVKSNVEYYQESKKIGDYESNKAGNFHNVMRPKSEEEELYVIIIGESTNRSHFGLYGYYRQTTPELNKLKDELLIYNDVISPHAYSIGALTKILTLANYESPENITKGSIIQLINSAGFDTYWLSNQRPIGPYESLITKISLSSKHHKFLTTTIAGKSKVLDGELFNEFNKTLKDIKRKKNVIFLHMMGTHHQYENRYPKAFNKFKDEPISNFNSKESHKKINSYDNAILYNDFLIAEAIKKVKTLNIKSFVLFFSDHGEEMFNDLDMAGHNEDIYSKNMLDIPFILWESTKYKKEKDLDFVAERKYMIDDLIYSAADLLDIEAMEIDYSRSIFNINFKERKRIIKDTINYDTYFKK
ncbi:MAG TPA: sulfatase-like hydrolase/transferase [Flavobacteriaceae bacterium]